MRIPQQAAWTVVSQQAWSDCVHPISRDEFPISVGRYLDDPCGLEDCKGVLCREPESGTHSLEGD